MAGHGGADGTRRDDPAAAPLRPDTAEQWTFDAVAADGSLAVSVGVGRRRGSGRGWYWLTVVGADRECVVVVDPDVALTSGSTSLEYRAPGLWADHNCSAASGHWSVAAEAFGVALTDPWQIWGRAFGDPTAVGADLEWDPVDQPVAAPGAAGATDSPDNLDKACVAGAWTVGCTVHGELLVGDERHELDCDGVRGHQWGTGVLGPTGWLAGSWRTPTGAWRHYSAPDGAPDGTPDGDGRGHGSTVAAPMLSIDLDGTSTHAEIVAWSPVLDDAANSGRLVMALARFTGLGADGVDHSGVGWLRYRPH